MSKKVFVCYDHSEDSQYKDVIATWDLNGSFEFMFDQRQPGVDFENPAAIPVKESLIRLMKEAEYLLVIVGEKSYDSKWMAWEIDNAKQREIKLKLAAVKVDESYTTPGGLSGTGVSYAYTFSKDDVLNALQYASNLDFNSLYDIYNAESLVMIVGSEVLHMTNQQGFANHVGTKTFEQQAIESITNQPYQGGPKTFSELAISFPSTNIISSNRLRGVYRRFRPESFDLNLVQLIADLPNIRLFIQTSFDTKLEEQLGADVEAKVWNHEMKAPLYLDLTNGKKKLVYLFGNVNEGISVFEEEQIDCLLNLSVYNEINKNKTPDRYSLLEFLKDKTLVFVGNNFSDWFMRLMIRTLYNAPITLQPDKAYIVNDSSRGLPFQRYFYDKFKIELIHDFPVEHFLNNLHRTIREKESFDNWYKPRRVFISYDRTDKRRADELKKCLNRKHIDAFLDTADMKIAEHEEKIKKFIQAPQTCIFVCLLSPVLLEKEEDASYVKRIEWKTASARFFVNRYLDETSGEDSHPPFAVVSARIDDFNADKILFPKFISENNIIPYDLAVLCDLIEEEVKNNRYEYK